MHRSQSVLLFGFRSARINLLIASCVAVCGGMLLGLPGCAGEQPPDVFPVNGTVTQNGQPLVGVIVTFSSKAGAPVASGVTDQNGRFQLSSYDQHDGAVPGEHQVAIALPKTEAERAIAERRSPEEITQAMEKDAQSGGATETSDKDSSIPDRYADPKQSGLSATVSPNSRNEFTFDLKESQ